MRAPYFLVCAVLLLNPGVSYASELSGDQMFDPVTDTIDATLGDELTCVCPRGSHPVSGAGATRDQARAQATHAALFNILDPSQPSTYWRDACRPKEPDPTRDPSSQKECSKKVDGVEYVTICFKFPCDR